MVQKMANFLRDNMVQATESNTLAGYVGVELNYFYWEFEKAKYGWVRIVPLLDACKEQGIISDWKVIGITVFFK